MNSKIILFAFTVIMLSACGVKAPPQKYPETAIDSYVKEYTGKEPTHEELERIKTEEEAAANKTDNSTPKK